MTLSSRVRRSLSLAAGLVAMAPLGRHGLALGVLKRRHRTYRQCFPAARTMYQSLLGMTEPQAEELAELFATTELRQLLAEQALRRASLRTARTYRDRIDLDPDSMALMTDLQQATGPVMIGFFQFGSVFSLILGLVKQVEADRPIHVIAPSAQSALAFQSSLRGLLPLRDIKVWSLDRRSDLRAFLAVAAASRTIVLCAADADGRYGATMDCRFLGRPARLAIGVVRLADAMGAPILLSHATGNLLTPEGAHLHLVRMITSDLTLKERLDMIAKELEQTFLHHPHEWRQLMTAGFFFHAARLR